VSFAQISCGIGYHSPEKYCTVPNTTQYRQISGNTQYPNAGIVLTLVTEFLLLMLKWYDKLVEEMYRVGQKKMALYFCPYLCEL